MSDVMDHKTMARHVRTLVTIMDGLDDPGFSPPLSPEARKRHSLLEEFCNAADPESAENRQAILDALIRRPYPEELFERDVAVVRNFCDRVLAKRKPPKYPTFETPVRAFHAACKDALLAMDIDPDTVTMRFRGLRGKKAADYFKMKDDREALATINVQAPYGQRANARFSINKNEPKWRWSPLWHKTVKNRVFVEEIALHEATHIEQVKRINSVDEAAIYRDMKKERALLSGLTGFYAIYRSTLLERQAHLRHRMFRDFAHGNDVRPESDYLRTDLLNDWLKKLEVQPA